MFGMLHYNIQEDNFGIGSKSSAILGKSNLDIKGGRVCSSSPLPTKLAMHIQDKINLSSINARIISTYYRFTGSETIWRQYKFRYLQVVAINECKARYLVHKQVLTYRIIFDSNPVQLYRKNCSRWICSIPHYKYFQK